MIIFVAGGVGFLVGYILGYGTVVATLRAVEKVVDKKESFSFKNWIQPSEEGGLIEPDTTEVFNKAESIDDLLK